MSKQLIQFSCGHTEEVDIRGPRQERERMIWVMENRMKCDACETAEREKDYQDAKRKAQEDGLPQLHGTEKQIMWAMQLRMQILTRIENILKEYQGKERKTEYQMIMVDRLSKLLSTLSEIDSASWWIDHRDHSEEALYEQLKHRIAAAAKAEEERLDPLAKSAIEESTIRPDVDKKGIVKVELIDNEILARYERDEDFRVLLKSLRFTWSGNYGAWRRHITEMCGSIEDRAAELVNALLKAGFIVTCLSQEVRDKAIRADYEVECDRWFAYESGTELRVIFPMDEKLSAIIKRLGGRWNGDKRAYIIGIARWNDLAEFERLYGFKYTVRARKAIDEYKARTESAIRVSIETKEQPQSASGDPIADILKSSREILPDLKDD